MKKNHKMRKIMLALFSAMLLVCVTIGATVAYLTSTATVTNTFTVGKVEITLDEAKVNEVGEPATPAQRVTTNNYHLFPGHTYTKDPTIHVKPNSEDCWLFVTVSNGIGGLEVSGEGSIAHQMQTNGWTDTGYTDDGNKVYSYRNKITKNPDGEDIPVFGSFTIKPEVKDVSNYQGALIIVKAYAIQADGFTTAEAAWAAAGSSFTTSAG